MKYFFDTSAFVKFFRDEIGTEKISEIILDKSNDIWIMELAKLEFYSALYRQFRNKELNENELNIIFKELDEDLENIRIEPFTNEIIIEAEKLLKIYGKDYGLRTLDALHLSSCYLISDEDIIFVSSDDILCKVAEKLDIKTINPVN